MLPDGSVEDITESHVGGIGEQLPTETETMFEVVHILIHETERVHNERCQARNRRKIGGKGNGTLELYDVNWNKGDARLVRTRYKTYRKGKQVM